MITIYVGPQRTKITVHKKLFCAKSPFFAAAFRPGFREAEDNEITLPEDDSEAFHCMTTFIYRGTVLKDPGGDPDALDGALENAMYLHVAIESYYLGDKLCMEEFANKTIDEIIVYKNRTNARFRPEVVKDIYARTRRQSGLRLAAAADYALLVTYSKYQTATQTKESEVADLCQSIPDFMRDFVYSQFKYRKQFFDFLLGEHQLRAAYRPLRPACPMPDLNPCDFHMHTSGQLCYEDSPQQTMRPCRNVPWTIQ